jgi:hypothetical protein
MSGFKISIEGLLSPRIKGKPHRYMFREFIKNLKVLRDDPTIHNEFFGAYVFDDNKEPPAPIAQHEAVCSDDPCAYCVTKDDRQACDASKERAGRQGIAGCFRGRKLMEIR